MVHASQRFVQQRTERREFQMPDLSNGREIINGYTTFQYRESSDEAFGIQLDGAAELKRQFFGEAPRGREAAGFSFPDDRKIERGAAGSVKHHSPALN